MRPPGPTRVERFDAYQRDHAWAAIPLAVAYKLFEDRGPYLAATVTYYAFVALFPMVLLFVSITGFVLQGDPHLQKQVVNSALGNLPGIGPTIRNNITGFRGSVGAVAAGVVGGLYGSLGATQAAQYALNTVYAVPRHLQPNPLRSRVRSLGLLAVLGTGVLVTSAVNVAVSTGNDLTSRLDVGVRIAAFVVGLAANVGLFVVAFRLLTSADLSPRQVGRGGLIGAVAWQLLQAVGARYVQREANHGSAFYGIFGVVLATIAWLYLESLVLVIAAEINVVVGRRLWPRALLTPFTDEVELTDADRKAYSSYAAAQRFKGFEEIRTRFRRHPR